MSGLSNDTKISLGVAVVVLAPSIWWASSINTKLDVVVNSLTSIQATSKVQDQKIIDIDKRLSVLEQSNQRRTP